MMKNNNLLVLMPFYNREQYIEEAIQSVVNQTYTDLFFVMIDDASTDNSYEIAKKYVDNKKIFLIKNKENRGCYYSRNRGLEFAKNLDWNFWTVHDSDDTSDKSRFEVILKFIEEDPSRVLIKTFYIRKYPNGDLFEATDGDGVAFMSRILFTYLGYYDDTKFSGDTEYIERCQAWIERYKLKYTIALNEEPLYFARLHTDNLILKYGWYSHRVDYFERFREEINRRSLTGNFYTTFNNLEN